MYKTACICLAALLFVGATAQNVLAQSYDYVWNQLSPSEVNTGTTDLRGIWGIDNGTAQQMQVFIVGQAGNIFHYTNGIWAHRSTGETRDLNGVYGFGTNSVFAVADTNRTIYYYDGA